MQIGPMYIHIHIVGVSLSVFRTVTTFSYYYFSWLFAVERPRNKWDKITYDSIYLNLIFSTEKK